MPQPPLTDRELKFLRVLKKALRDQAIDHQTKKEGPAGNVVFLRPDPLLYDFFTK